MSDAAGNDPTQRGWYADPSGLPQQRWWDGERWTEHLHDPVRNAYGDDGSAARSSVFNNFIWAIALLPVVSFAALLSAEATSPLLAWGIWVGSVVLAFLDRRQLERDGMVRPFHWAWTLLSPGVYVIGRSIIVRRRSGRSLAPMWAWATIMLVSILTAAGKVGESVPGVAALAG